jgi:uncharacterized protein YkwD
MSRLPLLAFALACLIAFALPATAAAGPEKAMLKQINAARAANGAPPVKLSRSLTSSCRSYAHQMARTGRFQHARNVRAKEILAFTRGRTQMRWVIKAWLRSPVHRRVLLGKNFRRVGIGTKKGRVGTSRAKVWVVRFR